MGRPTMAFLARDKPQVDTGSGGDGGIPAQFQPIVDKLPEQVQEHVKAFFVMISKPDEAQARGQAIAITFLQVWAAASAPFTALAVALLVVLDPVLASKHLETVEQHTRSAMLKAPAYALLPGAIGVVVLDML